MTPGLLLANHRNALKSTGPRAPARRGPRFGIYVKSMLETMFTLGEDPQAFAERLKKMIEHHQPVGPTETMLVEDVATLELERRRIDRAQCGLLVQQLEQKEIDQVKRAFQLGEAGPVASEKEALELGLRHAPESLAKYEDLLDLFENIIDAVRRREFTDTDENVLKAIYGTNPNRRGGGILLMFQKMKALPVQASPEELEQEKDLYALLLIELLEEQRDIATEGEIFSLENVEITRSMRNALLVPDSPRWGVMLRQKNGVDRQIERKLKLLLQLQKQRRAEEVVPVQVSAAGAKCTIETLETLK